MLKKVIDPAIENLKLAKSLCLDLDIETYSRKDTAPYYSSIGQHLRHVLDIFQCIINGVSTKTVDLTKRDRGTLVEIDPKEGLLYLNTIISKLEELSSLNGQTEITLKDDLGMGMVDIFTTLEGGLTQAHSHAIHHFASVGYILNHHNVSIPNKIFGYNPTTPIHEEQLS